MVWHSILKVPTNGPAEDGSFTNIIYTGMISGRTNQPVYNLVALNLPVSTHPSNLNLIASGFVKTPAGSAPSYGDQIYTVDTSTSECAAAPRFSAIPPGHGALSEVNSR